MVPSLRIVFFALALFATPALADLAAKETATNQALEDATGDVTTKTGEQNTACGASLTSQGCTDATNALKEATQAQLDADTEHQKVEVDIAAAAEKVKCGDVSDEDKQLKCKYAKETTLSKTKAAIAAIKKANEEKRKTEAKKHQEAEAESMRAVDDMAAALHQAIAGTQGVDQAASTPFFFGKSETEPVPLSLRDAQRKVDAKTTNKNRACATRSWQSCADAREALEEAMQQFLDANASYLKSKVDALQAAERVKCGNLNLSRECQSAKEATLKATIAAIEAIKTANQALSASDQRDSKAASTPFFFGKGGKSKTVPVPLSLRDAQRQVDAKTTNKNRACATRSRQSCADAREALEEATQQFLDANSSYLKSKVDALEAAERVKCGNLNLSTEGGKSECQSAKEATLKATIAAVGAIKAANQAQRMREAKEHQKAEAESLRTHDEVDMALQAAIARMQGKASFGSVPNFGTTKAANVATSPISAVTLSAVLGLAVVAAVVSRRSRPMPPTDTHGLVRDSDDNAADEHCTE